MSTVESSSTPKNHTTSGISKTLLTPCRRVGLSRSRKAPKNNSPQIFTSQEEITTAPMIANNSMNFKNNSVILAESPSSVETKLSKRRKQQKTLIHSDTYFENEHSSTKTLDKTPNLHQQAATQVSENSVSLNIPSTKHKQDENADIDLLKNPTTDEQQETCEETSAEERSVIQAQCSDSSSSSIIHTVMAQIHHPAAKRNLSFSEHRRLENANVSSRSKSSVESSEKNITKTLKRKFQLSRDDFGSDNDIVENTELKTKKLNFNQSMTSLARFNTQDYLSEYSKSPITFQKHLNTPDDDILFDFMPSEKLKFKTTDDSEKKDDKNYVAIFCPSITKSDAKELSNKLLTVSLERLNNQNLNQQDKKSHSEKMSCIQNKQKSNSKNTFENSSDEEFTSSPQNDKNRRENLIQFIAQLQIEVRSKKESLERLTQAQVYKKMHSPKKLNESSERWMKVCKIALGDLLTKMREFEPTEMDSLLTKLKIPDNIIVKLKL